MADEMLSAVFRAHDSVSTGEYVGNVWEIRWDPGLETRVTMVVDVEPGRIFDGFHVQVEPTDEPSPRTRQAWLEFLYDLYAHADPLLHMGRVLAYRSVSRSLNTATVVVTDGVDSQAFEVDLSSLEDTYPDAFATEFLGGR